jgi:hypothetical protein
VIGRGRADRSGLGGGGGACEACGRSSRACRVGAPPPRCAASVNPELRHGATKAKPRPPPVLVEAAAPSTVGARIGCRWHARVHAEFRTGRGAPFLRGTRCEGRGKRGGWLCVLCVLCVLAGGIGFESARVWIRTGDREACGGFAQGTGRVQSTQHTEGAAGAALAVRGATSRAAVMPHGQGYCRVLQGRGPRGQGYCRVLRDTAGY